MPLQMYAFAATYATILKQRMYFKLSPLRILFIPLGMQPYRQILACIPNGMRDIAE